MANTIDVSCPECQKKFRAPEEVQGKKVRCKGCNHVFVIPAATPAPAAKEAPPAPAKAKIFADEDDDGKGYGVANAPDENVLRCPHCAQALENPDAVICINCGYNLRTRQRVNAKKVIEASSGEQFFWLLPGFVCVLVVLGLIGFDVFFCVIVPKLVKDSMDWDFFANTGFKVLVVVFSGFGIFYAGKFAYERLFVNPRPPETEQSL